MIGRPLRLLALAALSLPPSASLSSPRRSASGPARRPPPGLRAASPAAGGGVDAAAAARPGPSVDARTWMFRGVHPVHYEVASSPPADGGAEEEEDAEIVPLVLLAGFGVASFHYRRLMRELLVREGDSLAGGRLRIYALDYLGQGRSWPPGCDDGESPAEDGLGYSADTWVEQVEDFVAEVVLDGRGGRAHLLGNSVGGYLSAMLASRRPDLVESLTLVNATPVWGLNLPGWDGRLPAPSLPRVIGRAGFDLIRNPDVIDKYLDSAYVHRAAHDGSHPDSFHPPGHPDHDGVEAGRTLASRIRECTEGDGGHAAFASILFSPPASDRATGTAADFYATLRGLEADVLLLFGEEDEWCSPPVARRMHSTLAGRDGGEGGPATRYVSLGGCGHCPVHEAPGATAGVVGPWLEGRGGRDRTDLAGACDGVGVRRVDEPWGTMTAREVGVEESRGQGPLDTLVSYLVG